MECHETQVEIPWDKMSKTDKESFKEVWINALGDLEYTEDDIRVTAYVPIFDLLSVVGMAIEDTRTYLSKNVVIHKKLRWMIAN